MKRNKPYLNSIRQKHPTVASDSVAYTSGAQKSFDTVYTDYIKNIETIDTAIRTIANIISLTKLTIVKKKNGLAEPQAVKNIDFDFPNENDSSVDFLRKLAVNVFSQGAGLIVTEEAKRGRIPGKMINFYNLDVGRVEAVSDGNSLITEFIYVAENGDRIPYPAEKCIYINDSIDPSNLLYSLSRLRALNDVILMQGGLVAQAKNMLAGGAKKASIISSDAPISDRNMKKIKKEFDSFMQSATSSSLFMNTPLNVTTVGNSMSGTEMLALLDKINTMMIEAFAIPPYLIGRYKGGANHSTEITYSNRIFFNMQIKPVLRNVELQMTRFLRQQLNLKDHSVLFNLDDLDILRLPYEEQVTTVLAQLKAGSITLNEARAMMELQPLSTEEGLDAADRVFMPAYLLGNAPVSYNDYDSDLERLLNTAAAGAGSDDEALPSGNSGGEDNENLIDDTRGGRDAGQV